MDPRKGTEECTIAAVEVFITRRYDVSAGGPGQGMAEVVVVCPRRSCSTACVVRPRGHAPLCGHVCHWDITLCQAIAHLLHAAYLHAVSSCCRCKHLHAAAWSTIFSCCKVLVAWPSQTQSTACIDRHQRDTPEGTDPNPAESSGCKHSTAVVGSNRMPHIVQQSQGECNSAISYAETILRPE
jgi:hypothetical protein